MSGKILYTATSYLPAIGGAQLHTHHIAQWMRAKYKVQIITQWAEQRTDWLLGTTWHAPLEPYTYVVEGVPVQLITLTQAERWRLLPFILGYYLLKPLAIEQIAQRLATKIMPYGQDCALIQNSRIGREPLSFASLKVARHYDIPFVLVPYHHPRWVGWNYREYISLYRQADALIALTEAEKETLIQLGVRHERVFVTGNGPHLAPTADPDRFRAQFQLDADAPLILFLGQKYRYKGFEAMLDAARLVWQKWPDAQFIFMGPRTKMANTIFRNTMQIQPDFAELPHSMRCRGILELDTVDLQTKTDALAACTMLCVPSTQESFGGVYTEAWMFNKPVIGGDIAAIREVIEEGVNGYVVPPTPELIAEKINYLLAYPSLAQTLGQAGREKVLHHYSWEILAQKTEAVYESLS
jgi:glycosyltransferase involved in cell wall biosynthesis